MTGDPNRFIRQSVQALHAYVPGEQPADRRVVKLNTNENPYPCSPRVAEALASLDLDALRRYPDPVASRLRERLAGLHGCGPENVFAGNGSDEVLALCTRAFVEDDGTIGFFDPSYSLYPVLAAIRCAATRPVPLAEDFGWWMPEDYDCSLFFLANPNAPTGMCFPRHEVRAFCGAFPGVVVIDEAYAEFADEDCVDLAWTHQNVLVSRTLSKSYSLAGLRVGYALGPAPLIEALFKLKDSYNLDALSQRLALAALSDVPHMRANAERIRLTRARLARALAGEFGYAVFPSDTNFVWTRPAGMPAERLFAELRREGVLVRYFADARTREHLRITIGTDEDVDALLEALRRIHEREGAHDA